NSCYLVGHCFLPARKRQDTQKRNNSPSRVHHPSTPGMMASQISVLTARPRPISGTASHDPEPCPTFPVPAHRNPKLIFITLGGPKDHDMLRMTTFTFCLSSAGTTLG